ncbi:MAG: F0F1 ATP synthase subunit A [Candidatus Margulisbacteria bacterium]|jgi:F-type H+-transporting ATPase subunit a|nr:F0F1 ATP synthase subunit A [Candidatus Margulisiibacteriota bacterium]
MYNETARVFLKLYLGGLDISITAPVLLNFLAVLVLSIFLLLAVRRLDWRPVRLLQNLLEYTVEFIENQIVVPTELDKKTWTPLFLSVFLFILASGWLGAVPGLSAVTGNINVTAALAALVFLIALFVRLRQNGPLHFFRSLLPEGVKGPMLLILLPIEIISQLFKPFSLAIRLFANMSGGHLLLISILGFTAIFNNILVGFFASGGAVLIILFELCVCVIQAYVFTFLSALSIGESSGEGH